MVAVVVGGREAEDGERGVVELGRELVVVEEGRNREVLALRARTCDVNAAPSETVVRVRVQGREGAP